MRSYTAPLPLPRRNFLGQALLGAGACVFSPSTGRADDSPGIVDRDLVAAMEQAELSLQFRGRTADECRAWQDRFRTKLGELMGDSTPPSRWTIVEESRVEFDQYT